MIKIDIILPVYFAPELTIRCCETLIKNTDFNKFDIKVIIIDDSGSEQNFRILDFFLTKLKISENFEILQNPKNEGFIDTCYTGINYRDSDYKILLNSDTIVMPNWLNEMVKVAESDDLIAMVNPNTNNSPVIDVPMPPGYNINILHEYFNQITESEEDFIDVVTATGFCLLIKAKYINEYGFFDRIYGKGYCEETDLYFRYITQGLRAVIARKAFVYHRGEASFTDRDNRYNANKQILMSRYKSVYLGSIGNFNKKSVLNKYRKETKESNDLKLDVIIFSPSNIIDGGGKKVINSICNALNEAGISATVACSVILPQNKVEDQLYAPIDINSLYEKNIQPKTLVFSLDYNAIDIVKYANHLHRRHGYLPKIIHLMQDVEGWFEANSMEDFEVCTNIATSKLIVSPFLEKTFKKNLNLGYHYATILNSISLDFSAGKYRKIHTEYTVCAMMRTDQKRGALLIENALELLDKKINNSINFISFGDHIIEKSFKNINIIQKGVCNEEQVASILQQSDVFIEASYFQGFGLTSFEALFSGCLVLSTYNNGAVSVLPDNAKIKYFKIGDYEELADKVLNAIQNNDRNQQNLELELLYNCSSRNINQLYLEYFKQVDQLDQYPEAIFFSKAIDVLDIGKRFEPSTIYPTRIRYKTINRFMNALDKNPFLYRQIKGIYEASKFIYKKIK